MLPFIYILLSIVTSIIFCYIFDCSRSDILFVGLVGMFFPVVLPILIIGWISTFIYNKIENIRWEKRWDNR